MRTAHPTKLRRIAAAGAAGLLGLPVVCPAIAAAQSASSETYNVGQLGAGQLKLNAGTPSIEKTVPLPGDWSGAKAHVNLVLDSTGLRAAERVRILVDGTTETTATIRNGTQTIAFSTGNLPGGGVDLEVLATSSDAHARQSRAGSTVLEPASGFSVQRTGVVSSIPSLGQLPGALASHLALEASPLTVVLGAHPSPVQLRAAMVAAGAIAKADGGRGIQVSTLEAPSTAALDAVTGPLLTIEQTATGPGRLSLERLSSGSLDLTVAGSATSLLDSARMLSSPWIRSLSGDSAKVPTGIASTATQASTLTSADMAPVHASGTGSVSATSTFSLPVDQVVTKGQATLRLGVDYDSPAGGRVQISLNGNTLGAYNAAPSGQTLRISTFKLASDWTENGNLLPAYFMHPGSNQVTVTAIPPAGHRASSSVARLSIDQGSGLAMSTMPRPATEQLALWPFPLYGAHAWSRTTVVLTRKTDPTTLGALIGAMANADRVTGVPADPQVTYAAPTEAQRSGNLLVVGSPALAALPYGGPLTSGLLAEMHILYGGVALIAYDAQALDALGQGYEPGNLNGSAVLIGNGSAHTIVSAPAPSGFGSPSRPWLGPAALLAVLVLGWVGVNGVRARRRLVQLPELPVETPSVSS